MRIDHLLVLVITLLIAGCTNVSQAELSNEKENTSYISDTTKISRDLSIADYYIPTDFTSLEKRANYIVSVKAIKDLGQDVVNGEVLGSRKEVEVLKGYKNVLKKGDKIIIIEPAYVKSEEYHAVENYIKMDDGNEYTLFLNEGDDLNEFGVVSLVYGKYSKNEKVGKGDLRDFSLYKEIVQYDFIAEHDEDIELYESLKEQVFNNFGD